MSRPEHVRCENCCYFEGELHGLQEALGDETGFCLKAPPNFVQYERNEVTYSLWRPITTARAFCGEFRAEWPGEKSGAHVEIPGLRESLRSYFEQAYGQVWEAGNA